MSLSYQPINPVSVMNPVVNVSAQKDYVVMDGGQDSTYRRWTSTSISTNSITFNCPPPSGSVFVDRKVQFLLPIRLTFTGVAGAGQYLINPSYDAPRAFPIANILETIQLTLNNTAVTYNCADTIQALLRCNVGVDLQDGSYSTTPTYMDQSQQYADLGGSSRSPLALYTDGIDKTCMQRGGFPYFIVGNQTMGDGTTVVTTVVDMVFCEPLFISPLFFGKGNQQGFYNLTAMDLTLNFISSSQIGNRVWSHINSYGGSAVNTITNIAVQIPNGGVLTPAFTPFLETQPLLLIRYVTPKNNMVISPNMPITYPYYDVARYITSWSTINSGVSTTMTANNIQLNSIPHRILVYVRNQNQTLQSSSVFSDTYFQIKAMNVQFMNRAGLLSSASPYELYQMSKKNGLNMNWTQWSGGPVSNSALGVTGSFSPIPTIGGVVIINPSLDFGLAPLEANGKMEQIMLQFQLTVQNISANPITPEIYIVIIQEGTFTIRGLGSSETQIGVISSRDILDASKSPFVNFHDIMDPEGGDFWTGLKNFGSKINDFLKNTKIISRVAASPLGTLADVALFGGVPVSKGVALASHVAGYGEGGELVTVGGKRMSRHQLRGRLY